MFRLMKLRPPNGWAAVGWELAVVTLGVIIALAAQQWAENQSWRAKTKIATAALKREVRDHHLWSLEWKLIEPCVLKQIDQLQRRVIASGDRLDPAPVYSEPGFEAFVLRMPSRSYEQYAWQATISDGVISRLNHRVRLPLSFHYNNVQTQSDLTAQNNVAYQQLLSLSRPLPLDPTVRFSLVQTLDELRGRVEYMTLVSRQMIGQLTEAGMGASAAELRPLLRESGTYRFCREQRLPTRKLVD